MNAPQCSVIRSLPILFIKPTVFSEVGKAGETSTQRQFYVNMAYHAAAIFLINIQQKYDLIEVPTIRAALE
jgi:hypothetical protein